MRKLRPLVLAFVKKGNGKSNNEHMFDSGLGLCDFYRARKPRGEVGMEGHLTGALYPPLRQN